MKRVKDEKCTLSGLKVGQKGKILAINILNSDTKRHLLEMGFTTSTIVKIKKIAPLGDPIIIELRGYELYMRKYELKKILVEVV